MSTKFDKLKDGFLQDLSNVTDDKMDQVKKAIGIKNNKPVNVKPSWFKVNKKPLTFALSSVMACLIIIITIVSVINYKNTPVYKEMTASNVETVQKLKNRVRKAPNDLEDDILNEIGVFTLPGIACYAKPEEEIIITVKIDNPKSYEILSFTLNGYKYQTFEFEYGSNSNQILVKFKTTDVSGIQKVTIDAIKYVDGDKIKDVRFDGNKTIQIGVTYQNIPTATIDVEPRLTNAFVEMNVVDIDNLIDEETGISIYLFDETNLVRKDNIKIGLTAAHYYPNLRLGSKYSLIIVGIYDLLDGAGKRGVILAQEDFITDEGYTYGDAQTGYDNVSVDLIKTNNFTGKPTKAKIYDNDNLVSEVELTDNATKVEFTGLLSNKEYKIVTTYEYTIKPNGQETLVSKEIETTITTDERPTPEVTVINQTITQTGISFDYEVTNDTTKLGKIINLTVYRLTTENEEQIETKVQSFDEDVKEITNLLSNNDYKFYATFEYNLLDGTGPKTLEINYTFKTLEKLQPEITFKDIKLDKKQVSLDYEIQDTDKTGKVVSVSLVKNEEIVKTIEITEEVKLLFNELLSDNDYTLRINYEYDLNDGNGIINTYVENVVHTLPLAKPILDFGTALGWNNRIYSYYYITDEDNIFELVRIEIYKDNQLINSYDNFDKNPTFNSEKKYYETEKIIENVEKGEYEIVIVYQYDLNDGNGTHLIDYENQPSNPDESNILKIDEKTWAL